MLSRLLFAQAGEPPPPHDDYWFTRQTPLPAAGIRPTPERVLQLTPVSACLRAIAETLATLPVHVYRELADGTHERDRDHYLNDLLRRAPNALMTSSEWFDFMTRTAALRGNGYSRVVRSDVMVHRLIPLPHDTVTPRVEGFSIRYEIKSLGAVETLGPDDVIHLRVGDTMTSGLLAEDPITASGDTFAAAIAAQDYAARYFANDATPRGVVEVEGAFKDEEKAKQFMDKLKRALSFRNQHSNLVLTGGAKYKQVGATNKDSQLIELRRFYVVELCRVFGVPPHVAKDLEDATYSNIEQQALEFVKHTIMPWVVRWEQLIRRALIREPDVFVKFNLDALTRGDIATRYAAFASAINTGWMTRNEARELEDRNPLPGLDEPVMQGAMTATPRDPEPKPEPSPRRQRARDAVEEEATALRAAWADKKPGEFKAWTRIFQADVEAHVARWFPEYDASIGAAYAMTSYKLINSRPDIEQVLATWEARQLPMLESLLEAHS